MDPTALGKHCDTSAILTPCLTQSQFVQTSSNLGAQTNWGNIPPNAFYGPGYFDIDTQVTKTVRIRERMNLQIGASIYNTLNHPNFGQPNGTATGATLGTITGTVSPSFRAAATASRLPFTVVPPASALGCETSITV